ncbi:MAG: hypothetical protein RL136_1705 [Planctomycetota bacterium]|jgi:ADP-ribose pyrophosphatase
MIVPRMPDPQVDLPDPSGTESFGAALSEPEVTHRGPVFSVERLRVPIEGGDGVRIRDVVRHPGAVAVIAQRDDGALVLVRNRRVAVDRWLVEFCAGKLEPGPASQGGREDPALAAARELEEETGYRASRIESLGWFYTSPGFADERMHVFLATGLVPVPQRLEPGEELEVVVMDEPSLREAIVRGEVVDGKTLGAYLLWTLRRAEATHE